MGGGATKAHEAFTVSPAVAVAVATPSASPAAVSPPSASAAQNPTIEAAGAAGAAGAPSPKQLDPTGDLAAAPATTPTTLEHGPTGGNNHTDEHTDMLVDDAVTPIPASVPIGEITGTPLLVGGADLDDSLATLVAYHSPDGPVEVLHAVVTEPAEAKLLEAVAAAKEHLVPVTVTKDVHGRLPLDETSELYEQLVTVAKSVNHHLKLGDGIPQATVDKHAALAGKLDKLSTDPATTADEHTMLAHYQAATAEIGSRLAPGFATPYQQGGKVPTVEPHTVAHPVTVTEMQPAPAAQPSDGRLAARIRNATRIRPTITDGTADWDRKARAHAAGKEYVIDLGDGYQAVYRPHAPDKGVVFSQRGSLELVAPAGAGHGPELVRRLGRLHLVNRPMTAAEGEWAYLSRNIWAQQLDQRPGVAAALTDAQGLEDAVRHQLIADRAGEAIGLDEPALEAFSKQLLLDAEAAALPHKVHLVRDAVAKARGLASGEALTADPAYDPTPRRSGGWLVWDRFDVVPGTVDSQFGGRGLRHAMTGNNLVDVLRSGVLASTERRRLMGVKTGLGKSESADMESGGAKSVFVRVGSKSDGGTGLYWDQPGRLLRRADWYAYPSDHFGSLNPASSHSVSGQTRNPTTVAGFDGSLNEVMFRNGIDLFGSEAPTRICCGSTAVRDEILALLAERGITELGGKPVSQVVTV
jgi:hypothetical protein